MKSTKPYEEEFKKRAVEMLRNSGKPAVQIARELGCTADSLRTWKRKYDNPLEGCLDPDELTPAELKRENARLRKEHELRHRTTQYLKKSRSHLGAMNTKEKHHAITHLKNKNHSLSMLCQLFETSPSGYFSSLKTKDSPRKNRREKLMEIIKTIFTQHQNRYGRPRIYRQLMTEGEPVSEKMVGRLMRSQSLQARKKRSFRPRTTQNTARSKYAPNLLKDRAVPDAPNEVIVTDITYVATKENWLYLAAVMDLHSKKIKGYEIQETMQTGLISKALEKAMKYHPGLTGAIHHSDRGSQYTSSEYLKQLAEYGLQSSMSAKGNCYDNAAMESFWSTLKTEAFPESGVFESKEAAKQAIFEYIEGYYHTQRMHSSLNYLTPLAAEMAAKKAA